MGRDAPMIRWFCLVALLLLLCSCTTAPSGRGAVERENEIAKELRLFANDLTQVINQLSPGEARVLVVDFTDLRGKFTYLGTYVSDKLAEELSRVEQIRLVNRADIELIMEELSFQHSGVVSEADVIRLGEFSGANVLVSGTITDLGDEIDVSAKTTNIRTSEVAPASFRMLKTKDKMALIRAITIVEAEKEEELNALIEKLQSEIDRRKQELKRLMTSGAEEVASRLRAEEEQKRQELDARYERRLQEIEAAIKLEEQEKRKQLTLVEQQLREKSTVLARLREQEKQLQQYETEIGRIQARIMRQNNAVEYYVTNGMTPAEVARVLGEPGISITTDFRGPWRGVFNSSDVSSHGDYVIVWSDHFIQSRPVVIGFCNRRTGECYTRSVGE